MILLFYHVGCQIVDSMGIGHVCGSHWEILWAQKKTRYQY